MKRRLQRMKQLAEKMHKKKANFKQHVDEMLLIQEEEERILLGVTSSSSHKDIDSDTNQRLEKLAQMENLLKEKEKKFQQHLQRLEEDQELEAGLLKQIKKRRQASHT